MIGNSITASVNPKWKKVPVNNGVTIGQYNRKQVFSFCRKELLLLPHTHKKTGSYWLNQFPGQDPSLASHFGARPVDAPPPGSERVSTVVRRPDWTNW